MLRTSADRRLHHACIVNQTVDGDRHGNDRGPHDRRDLLCAAAARRVVGGVVEFGLHRPIPPIDVTENRAHLVPQRLVFAIAVGLRRRRLRRAHGIGGRKGIDQAGLELLVDFPVGPHRLAGIGGVLVMRRRIEFLSHRVPPLPEITSRI